MRQIWGFRLRRAQRSSLQVITTTTSNEYGNMYCRLRQSRKYIYISKKIWQIASKFQRPIYRVFGVIAFAYFPLSIIDAMVWEHFHESRCGQKPWHVVRILTISSILLDIISTSGFGWPYCYFRLLDIVELTYRLCVVRRGNFLL